MPGPSVFPSGEPGVSGDFWGSHQGHRVKLFQELSPHILLQSLQALSPWFNKHPVTPETLVFKLSLSAPSLGSEGMEGGKPSRYSLLLIK